MKFIGYVTDEELVALYKYASCFVYPSLYEGFGLPPLEAIYFNCPVIVSDIDVFKEIYGNNVLYCDKNKVSSLKEKILYLYNNKNAISNEQILNKYKWNNTLNNILKELKML